MMPDERNFEELRDDVVAAYEESTGFLPDTRDYVAIEEATKEYLDESD